MCGVDVVQNSHRLDLDDHTFLDQEVSDKISDKNIPVTNFDPVLLRDPQANLPELYGEGVFVNLFKKSGTEDIAHLMHAADDLFRNLIQS